MLFILIPAYNEEQNLPLLIPTINRVVCSVGEEFSILVINDGSGDGTLAVCHELSQKAPVRIFSHEINRGIGAVFNTGLRVVSELSRPDDIVVLMEADGTNDPALLSSMIMKMKEGHDVVIASRFAKGGKYHKFPLKRLLLSKVANWLVRRLFPIEGAKDYTIFYRAYRAGLLQNVMAFYKGDLIEARTFFANAELLIKLDAVGKIKVVEVPLVYRHDLKKSKSGIKIKETLSEYFRFIMTVKRSADAMRGWRP